MRTWIVASLRFEMTDDGNFINSFASWQPDEDMQSCLNCHVPFSFLMRKHHCRCCGGIFCAGCSERLARYDTKRVKVVKRHPSDDSEYPPFRTCDSCYDNLLHLKLLLSPWGKPLELSDRSAVFHNERTAANRGSLQRATQAGEVVKSAAETERTREVSQSCSSSVRRGRVDDDNCCPICNYDLATLANEEAAQNHVEECLRRASDVQQHLGSPEETESPAFQNRMLVYKVAPAEDSQYRECPICFEDMAAGDKVGRLECLCMFHYKCIKGWFNKKAQRMKSKDIQYIGKNFCPLHDAIF